MNNPKVDRLKRNEYKRKYAKKYYLRTQNMRSRTIASINARIKDIENIPELQRSVCDCERLKGFKVVRELNIIAPPEFFEAARMTGCRRTQT